MPVKKKTVAVKKEHVVVKKEPLDKVVVKKEIAVKSERKVKTESTIKTEIKKEVKIKKERTDAVTAIKEKWEPMKHFKHQVAFLNEIVPQPWSLCFGALGTGIIGIQPEAGSSSSSSSPAPPLIKQEVKEEAHDEDDEGLIDANTKYHIPSDATIVLLLNGPSCNLQSRNNTMFGGYTDSLDVESKSMVWTTQRGDRYNRKISAICAHSQHGGRIAVGIRGDIMGARNSFKLLGFVSHIDELKETQFLVAEGDTLIAEGGRLHKNITAACLDAGLKAGIGLTTRRYPLPPSSTEKWKFCCKCCYVTATCRLHFEELKEEGIHAYRPFARRKRTAAIKDEDYLSGPRRRLRFKQELPDSHSSVKKEPAEEKVEPEERAHEEPQLPPAQSRSDLDEDWEPPDPPSLLVEETGALDPLDEAFDSLKPPETGALDPLEEAFDSLKTFGVDSGPTSAFASVFQLKNATCKLASLADPEPPAIDLE